MASKSENKNVENIENEDRVQIVIPKPADVVGDTETVVGLNGTLYHIKYDAQVSVPKGVAEIVEQSRKIQNRLQSAKESAEYKAGKASIADL